MVLCVHVYLSRTESSPVSIGSKNAEDSSFGYTLPGVNASISGQLSSTPDIHVSPDVISKDSVCKPSCDNHLTPRTDGSDSDSDDEKLEKCELHV